MRKNAIDGIGARGAGRAARLIAGAEHEVIDEELRPAVEQLGQGPDAVVGLEAVLLLDPDPRQLAPLPRQVVAHPRVLLFAHEERLASGQPLLPACHLVVGHAFLR
jgi:hypothetical protein